MTKFETASISGHNPLPVQAESLSETCSLCGRSDRMMCPALVPSGPDGARRSPLRRYDRDQTVFAAGDPPGFAGFLRSGVLRMERLRPDGDRVLLGLLFPGAILGLPDQSRLTYTLAAATDVEICVFDPFALRRIRAQGTGIRRRLLQIAEEQHARQLGMLWKRGALGSRDRVTAFLVMAARHMVSERLPDGSIVVDIDVSRRDWADWSNTTVETICRTFGQLAEKKLITAITPRRFRIHNLDALARLAGLGPDDVPRPSVTDPDLSGRRLRAVNAPHRQTLKVK